MTASPNPVRARLQRGEVAVGFGVRLAPAVELGLLTARCGYDWLFIDLEHSPMSLETAAAVCISALGAGIAPLARIPAADFSMAARMLDSGAWGVLMSHVEAAEQAAELVRKLKFPPLGHRSVSYGMPQLDFQSPREAAQRFNEHMLLVAMVESPEAIAKAGEIAAVPGIDALFVGTNDLSMEMGIPGDFGNPKIAAACKQVVTVCHEHQKWPAMGGVYSEGMLRRYIGMGMRMILGGTDMALLMESARQRAEMIRRCISLANHAER